MRHEDLGEAGDKQSRRLSESSGEQAAAGRIDWLDFALEGVGADYRIFEQHSLAEFSFHVDLFKDGQRHTFKGSTDDILGFLDAVDADYKDDSKNFTLDDAFWVIACVSRSNFGYEHEELDPNDELGQFGLDLFRDCLSEAERSRLQELFGDITSLQDTDGALQDASLLTVVKGVEHFTFVFEISEKKNLLRHFGTLADSEEDNFSWYDAAVLSQKVRSYG